MFNFSKKNFKTSKFQNFKNFMKTTILISLLIFCVTIAKTISQTNNNTQQNFTNQFTDKRDGKVYKTVEVGKQIWFAENLAFKSNSGCWAYDYDTINVAKYGYLYNWETANKVCPVNWHLPTDDEWKQLEMELGMSQNDADTTGFRGIIGDKFKAQTGFAATMGGYRSGSGSFDGVGRDCYCWTASSDSINNVWYRLIFKNNAEVYRFSYLSSYGFSVRCIRD